MANFLIVKKTRDILNKIFENVAMKLSCDIKDVRIGIEYRNSKSNYFAIQRIKEMEAVVQKRVMDINIAEYLSNKGKFSFDMLTSPEIIDVTIGNSMVKLAGSENCKPEEVEVQLAIALKKEGDNTVWDKDSLPRAIMFYNKDGSKKNKQLSVEQDILDA